MSIKLLNCFFAISSIILTVFLVEYVNVLRESGSIIKLLGAMPNFIAATFGVFIFLPFVHKLEVIHYYFFYCVGLTIYEFHQLNMPTQTFDFHDVIATWFGFMTTTCFFKAVTSSYVRLNIQKFFSRNAA